MPHSSAAGSHGHPAPQCGYAQGVGGLGPETSELEAEEASACSSQCRTCCGGMQPDNRLRSPRLRQISYCLLSRSCFMSLIACRRGSLPIVVSRPLAIRRVVWLAQVMGMPGAADMAAVLGAFLRSMAAARAVLLLPADRLRRRLLR